MKQLTKLSKMHWIQFTTETGLKAAYQITGEDFRNDVKIKIVTSTPKGFIHSAINEASDYYDEIILPTLKFQQT